MIEFKLEDGTTRLVPGHLIKKFKLEFPGAIKIDEPGKTTDPASGLNTQFEEGVAREEKYNPIDKQEFINASTESGFGLFVDGREEIIVEKLKNQYKFDKNGELSGIKFEETGSGNNVLITLDGSDYGRPFNLSGDAAEASKTYTQITEYIESAKRKEIPEEMLVPFEEVFTSRQPKLVKPEHGAEYMQYHADDGPLMRDDRMAEELSLIFEGDNIKFKESGFLHDALEVTLSNGNTQTFNVNPTSNPNAFKIIKRFIESDNRSRKQTTEYQEATEDVDNWLDNQFANYDVDDMINLNTASKTEEVHDELHKLAGHGVSAWVQSIEEKFPNLSSDEVDELIDDRIQNVVNIGIERKTNRDARTNILKLKEKMGDKYTPQLLIDDVMKNGMAGYKPGSHDFIIATSMIALEDETLSPEERKVYEDTIFGVQLKKKEKGVDYKFYMNPSTLERSTSAGKKEGKIVDLTNQVHEKEQEIADKKYTRKELKAVFVTTSLAKNQADYDFKNKKRLFHVPDKATRRDLLENHQVTFKGNSVRMTDQEAQRWLFGKGVGKMLKTVDQANDHKARLTYHTSLNVRMEALKNQYLLNKDITSITKGGMSSVEGRNSLISQGFEGVAKSFYGAEEYTRDFGGSDLQIRQGMLNLMYDQGMEVTETEKQWANSSTSEASVEALGGIPKIAIEFAIANKLAAVVGAFGMVQKIEALSAARTTYRGVKMSRAAFEAKAIASLTRSKVITKGMSQAKINTKVSEFILKKNIKFTKASFGNRAHVALLKANMEGLKMEFVGRGPLEGFQGESGHYMTGFGFGLAGSTIPWPVLKQKGWGASLYDYAVKTPINFAIGSQFGAITNAAADDLMGNKSWGKFVDEHYGDYDELQKHLISDLVMGFAMRFGHMNRFDFKSVTKIDALRTAAKIKRDNYYEKNEDGTFKKTNGKHVIREGMEDMVNAQQSIIDMATIRLHEAQGTKDYLDPILGPVKMARDMMGTTNELSKKEVGGKKREVRIDSDFGISEGGKMPDNKKMDYEIVKIDGKEVIQFVFNPKLINPGLPPHELGHAGLEILFGEDVMFKTEFINSLTDILKTVKLKSGMSIYQAMVEKGVWTQGDRWNHERTKHQELFGYTAEYLSKVENMEAIENSLGWEKLTNLIETNLEKRLKTRTNLNTQKEVVQWFNNYIETVKKGKSAVGNFKHLEKFISTARTEKQMKARKNRLAYEKRTGKGDTPKEKLNSLNLEKETLREIVDVPLEQYKTKKITADEYREAPIKVPGSPEIKTVADAVARIKDIDGIIKNTPKEQSIITSEQDKDAFQNTVQDMYNNPKQSISDKAFFIAEQYHPKNTSAGAARLARELNKYSQRDGFNEVYDKMVDDIVTGMGREKKRGKGDTKARSIRQIILDYHKLGIAKTGVPLSGYIGKTMWGGKGKKGRGILEYVNYYMPDLGFRVDMNKTKDLVGDAGEKYKMTDQDLKVIYGDSKLANEILIDKKEFEADGGWQETILDRVPNRKYLKDKGYKDLNDLAPEFTQEFFGVKLSKSQQSKPNDLGEANLRKLQEWVDNVVEVEVTEKTPDGEGRQSTIDLKTKETKTRKIENAQTLIDLLPDGAVSFELGVKDVLQGKSTFGRLGTLAEFYHRGTDAELKELGFYVSPITGRVKTPAGQRPFIKNKDISVEQMKRYIGIVDGSFTTLSQNRSLGGKGRRLMDEFGKLMTNQVIREKSPFVNTNISFDLGSGRSRKYFSEVLEDTNFEDQRRFMDQIQTKEFNMFLIHQLEKRDKKGNPIKNPLGKALVGHFEQYRQWDIDFDISPEKLLKIGDQLAKEFINTEISQKRVVVAAGHSIVFPNTIEGVANKYELSIETGDKYYTTEAYLADTRILDNAIAVAIEKKLGKGAYMSFLMDGASTGGGYAKYKTRQDAIDKVDPGRNRYAFRETANSNPDKRSDTDVYNMLETLPSNKNTHKGPSRTETNLNSDAQKIMEAVRFTPKSAKIDIAAVKKYNAVGEKTKDALKDVVEIIGDLYNKGKVDHHAVAIFLTTHAASMKGLIKKSASLAVIPDGMSPKELFKIYPEFVKNENTGKMERGWVLEHGIPAKYVKARIFDYILSRGKDVKPKDAADAKSNYELTLKDFNTAFIPKSLDKMVNKLYIDRLPFDHLPGMDIWAARYYEASHASDFSLALKNAITGKSYDRHPFTTHLEKQKLNTALRAHNTILFPKIFRKNASKKQNSEILEDMSSIDKAIAEGRKGNKKARGMSTFDFDETVGISDNFVIAKKGGKTKKIASHEWPFVGEKLKNEGWEMDFSDFNKVTKGKPGPLMEKMKNQIKKFGPDNVFILTARAQESAKAIHEYLKSEGIKIPLKNITGLGNSTGEAKAMWMLEKFSEGYNDMYFVDDALPNVKAVKNVLDQLDIKSKVQQALASKNLNKGVNDIMEGTFGIESKKRFSKAEGKVRGKDKKRRVFFIPDSAADLELLIEPLLGKGKKGIENKKWFNENFHKPFERGINDLNTARQTILNDYMSLRKQNKDVVKSLDKPVEGTNFTVDQAVRVYIWNKAGFEAPGLTKTSKAKLLEHVASNPKLQAYAENVAVLTKIETGLKKPNEHWWAETLATEVSETGRTIGREKYISDWVEKKNEIFSKENLAKMESELGPRWREAIDGMLYRMETGAMRAENLDRLSNEVMDYLNGSTGAIMHLNTRSAALQLISTVNFINHGENNPFAAARAFANLPQYTKDFMFIMNSPMLKQRRDGLQINVSEAELAAAASSGKKGGYQTAKRMLATILKHGYLPTKIADSFAIASGGATYYRNRIKMYEKQGLKTKEAEKKAWIDFQAIAEKTQQSSRPDLLSQQQVSVAGRIILPFGNTPMQMNRIAMKEQLDVAKGRYDGYFGENSLTHKMSKISYYYVIQSAIFAGLQSAAFALWTMGDDEPLLAQKKSRAANTMADSFLRGMGISGAVAAGFKNAVIKFLEQNKKGFNADYSEVGEALLNISPTIGSKFSGMDGTGNTFKYNKKEILEKGFSLDNTKGIEAAAQTIQAITNAPTYNYIKKNNNIQSALDKQNAAWQRIHNIWGYSAWDVGATDYQTTDKKLQSIIKKYKKDKNIDLTIEEAKKVQKGTEIRKLNINQQRQILSNFEKYPSKVVKLNTEKKRINKILEYWEINPKTIDSLLLTPLNKEYNIMSL